MFYHQDFWFFFSQLFKIELWKCRGLFRISYLRCCNTSLVYSSNFSKYSCFEESKATATVCKQFRKSMHRKEIKKNHFPSIAKMNKKHVIFFLTWN